MITLIGFKTLCSDCCFKLTLIEVFTRRQKVKRETKIVNIDRFANISNRVKVFPN